MLNIPITLIALLAVLGLWVIRYKSGYLLILVVLTGLIHGLSRYYNSLAPPVAFLSLAVDMIVLAVFSITLIITRKNPFVQWGVFFLTVGGLISLEVKDKENVYEKYDIDSQWEIIIKTEPENKTKGLDALIKQYELTTYIPFQPLSPEVTDLDDYLAIGIPDKHERSIVKISDELKKLPEVLWVEFNERLYHSTPEPAKSKSTNQKLKWANDPLTDQQWAMSALGVDEYLNTFINEELKPTRKARIFILDSGIDAGHEDLSVATNGVKKEYLKDVRGHGTHCAGIAGAITNNGKGIASLSPGTEWVDLYSIKVINDMGFGTQKQIIAGIIEAVDMGADVINLSLGARAYQSSERAYQEAIEYALLKKVVVVAAAGNSSGNARDFVPAKLEDVITVAALDPQLNLATFSNHVKDVSYGLSAPGVDILSTFPGGEYKTMSGTSMAAPFVTGLAGVLKAYDPDLDHKDIHRILSLSGLQQNTSKEKGAIINPSGAIKNILEKKTVQ